MLGMKQVYPGRYEPEMLVKLWREEKVTFSHCVPTILQMLLNCPSAQGEDFGGWKIIIGGSALNRALYEAALARGIQLTAAYGMSETCPLISCAHLNDELQAGSEDERISYRIKAGVPVPLVEAAIVDGNGNFLPADGETQGELVLRAPWLTQGYFKESEKSEELWAGGWLHTGDVATLDGMGYIDIRDRIKDVIKTGGEWISSLDLEDLISRHPAVREVAVVGVADPQWGERPFALLVVREGQAIDARALRITSSRSSSRGTSTSGRSLARSRLLLKFPRPVSASSTRSVSARTSSSGRPVTARFCRPCNLLRVALVCARPAGQSGWRL